MNHIALASGTPGSAGGTGLVGTVTAVGERNGGSGIAGGGGGSFPSVFDDAQILWRASSLSGSTVPNDGDGGTLDLTLTGSPTLTSDGDLSYLTFDGSTQYGTAGTGLSPSTEFTQVSVVATSAGGRQYAKNDDGTSESFGLRTNAGDGSMSFRCFAITATSDSTGWADGVRHVASVRRSDGSSASVVRVDGDDSPGVQHQATMSNGDPWSIMSRLNGTNSLLAGDWYLFAQWNRELSVAELAEIEAFFESV